MKLGITLSKHPIRDPLPAGLRMKDILLITRSSLRYQNNTSLPLPVPRCPVLKQWWGWFQVLLTEQPYSGCVKGNNMCMNKHRYSENNLI